MSTKVPSLETLIHELTKLPGIGEKTAQRLAYHVLRAGPSYSQSLRQALDDVQKKIKFCNECFSYTENEELCDICANPKRESQAVCVVEEPSDIFRVENSGAYHGVYHVLHGAISPLEGVGPDDLKIKELLRRLDGRSQTEAPIKEVIFALDADLEGDTTTLYLAKLLSARGIKATRIAYGVPFGADIDFIDRRTLGRALENRVEL